MEEYVIYNDNNKLFLQTFLKRRLTNNIESAYMFTNFYKALCVINILHLNKFWRIKNKNQLKEIMNG